MRRINYSFPLSYKFCLYYKNWESCKLFAETGILSKWYENGCTFG